MLEENPRSPIALAPFRYPGKKSGCLRIAETRDDKLLPNFHFWMPPSGRMKAIAVFITRDFILQKLVDLIITLIYGFHSVAESISVLSLKPRCYLSYFCKSRTSSCVTFDLNHSYKSIFLSFQFFSGMICVLRFVFL